MKAFTLTCLLLLTGVTPIRPPAGAPVDRSAPPPLPAPRPFVLTDPDAFTLSNGLRVLLISRGRAPLVDIVAHIDAGIASDPPALPGLASFTSAMLLEGAGARDALAFADAEALVGAKISAGVGIDAASVTLHVSRARFAEALPLFADVLVRPRFEGKDWARTQKSLLGDMIVQGQDPTSLAALAAARAAWGPGHRFAVDAGGTPRSLQAATAGDIAAFHRARYRPDTTTLIVVGAITRAELTRSLEDALGNWQASGPRPAPAALGPPLSQAVRTVVGVQVDGAPQTVVRVVGATPGAVKPYDAAADVMNTLLGGSFTSRLNDNLREQHGYAYGAGSRFVFTRAGTVFAVRTAVQANATVPAVAEILLELDRIHSAATTDEVTRARNLVALSFPGSFDSGSSIAATWSEALTAGVDGARIRAFLDDVPRVDADALRAAGARAVDPERVSVVLAGDLRPHDAELLRLGPRVTLTAEDLLPGLAEAQRGAN